MADMQTMHVRTCPLPGKRAHSKQEQDKTQESQVCSVHWQHTVVLSLQQTRPLMMTKAQVQRAVPAGACFRGTGVVLNSIKRPRRAAMQLFGVRRGRNGPLCQAPMLPLGVWVAAGQASTSHTGQIGSG